MSNPTAASNAPSAYDPDATLAIALELSGKSWEMGAVVPGVNRRPRRRLDPRDMAALLLRVERWKAEAGAAGRTIKRVVLTYEACPCGGGGRPRRLLDRPPSDRARHRGAHHAPGQHSREPQEAACQARPWA